VNGGADAARIDYLVSRFPKTSETFILREIDALDRRGPWELGLRSLFRSPDSPTVHESAARWTGVLRRPGVVNMTFGMSWAMRRRPRALADVLAVVIRAHTRRPGLLVRAVVTVVLAAAHARELADVTNARIHAHFATYPTLAAWVCHRLAGTRYGFTAHAHDLYVDRTMLTAKMAEADYVITVSEFNRRLLESVPGTSETPVRVVHCGIDTARYSYRPRVIPSAGPIRALCVASLEAYKGHRVLFEAIARGGPGVDRIELDLVGDGPLRAGLVRLSRDFGLDGRIRFLGQRSERQVRRLLADADLFVLPSVVAVDGQMEGLPVALVEALACGVPAVSTALSGVPEIVVDEVTGLLATPGDAGSLRDALERTVADVRGTERRARDGRRLVEEHFDLDACVDRLVDVVAGHVRGTSGRGVTG